MKIVLYDNFDSCSCVFQRILTSIFKLQGIKKVIMTMFDFCFSGMRRLEDWQMNYQGIFMPSSMSK